LLKLVLRLKLQEGLNPFSIASQEYKGAFTTRARKRPFSKPSRVPFWEF
jgi:hypothetical protein